jgi:hypothetical protein
MMWTQLEKKILLRLLESMGVEFGCGKETGYFLTCRETSISKVQCVSRVVTVIECHKLWLVRIFQKSVSLILTARYLLCSTAIAGLECERKTTHATCNNPQIPTVPPRVARGHTTTTFFMAQQPLVGKDLLII